ncbi:MAG: alpha/beta hydrolase [Micrococcales bacterium]|nr:alpha/beta hydrolase [Micrococcales bacterium]
MNEPKGVPRLPSLPGSSRSRLPGLGIALGLTAAGLTAAAGFAADRLNRERRVALALDETVTIDPFHEAADEELVVRADDGVDLHVEVDHARGPDPVSGGGLARPTFVLCHGYCLSLRAWVFQRRALREAGYRVVLWDQRGHGRSGTGARDSYHVDQLGRDLARVLEVAVPQGPIVLVGHSMGGMAMMALALDLPELVAQRVIGAAFVATSPGNLAEVTYGIGTLAGRLVHRLVGPTTGLLSGRQGFVDGTIKAGRDVVDLFVDWGSFGSPVPMSVAQLTTDMIFGTRMEVISAFMPRFDDLDKHEALARFDGIETLVISGMEDRITPPEHSEEIVRLVPGAEHVLVAKAGHVIMLEHPDLLSAHFIELARRAERAGDAEESARARQPDADQGEDAGDAGRHASQPVRHTVTDVSAARRAAQVRRQQSPRRLARPRRPRLGGGGR